MWVGSSACSVAIVAIVRGPLAVGTGLDVAGRRSTTTPTSKQLADNLFSDNVFAFELTSVLLIVAVAGTVRAVAAPPKPVATADEQGRSTT